MNGHETCKWTPLLLVIIIMKALQYTIDYFILLYVLKITYHPFFRIKYTNSLSNEPQLNFIEIGRNNQQNIKVCIILLYDEI